MLNNQKFGGKNDNGKRSILSNCLFYGKVLEPTQLWSKRIPVTEERVRTKHTESQDRQDRTDSSQSRSELTDPEPDPGSHRSDVV